MQPMVRKQQNSAIENPHLNQTYMDTTHIKSLLWSIKVCFKDETSRERLGDLLLFINNPMISSDFYGITHSNGRQP